MAAYGGEPTIGSRASQSGSTQSFDGFERTARTFARSYHSPFIVCLTRFRIGKVGHAWRRRAVAEPRIAPDRAAILASRDIMPLQAARQVNATVRLRKGPLT